MNRILGIAACLLLLAACDTNQQDAQAIGNQAANDVNTAAGNAERHTMRVANNVRDGIKRTSMKLREWWLTPLPNPEPPPVPPSYCYHTVQDILCYRQPMPGMTHKLVGYQGDHAAPPPVAQTDPLPTIGDPAAIVKPAATFANVKPIIVSPPKPVQQDKNADPAPAELQVESEQLPDPAISPQL